MTLYKRNSSGKDLMTLLKATTYVSIFEIVMSTNEMGTSHF